MGSGLFPARTAGSQPAGQDLVVPRLFWPGIRSFSARTAGSWPAGRDSALSRPGSGRSLAVLAGDPVLPGHILAGIRPFPGQNGRILADWPGIRPFPGQNGWILADWPGSGRSSARSAIRLWEGREDGGSEKEKEKKKKI